jgi:predicted RNase H-like HicB family nuclease
MIRELGSTRLRNPESRKVHETNSNVSFALDADNPFAIEFRYAPEDYWIVRDTETGIFGHGDTPSDALADFHRAAAQHLDVLEREPALSEELTHQYEYLRDRIRR